MFVLRFVGFGRAGDDASSREGAIVTVTTLTAALNDQADRYALDPGITIAAAIELAAIGFHIVPIVPGLKRPPFKTGPGHADAATRDSEQLAAWFETSRWEIGLVLHLSGHIAIDVDLRRETSTKTIVAFTRLEALAYPPHPDSGPFTRRFSDMTATQVTPKHGWHYIFQLPEGTDGGTLRSQLAPNVELQRHILVVAPSRGRRWIRHPHQGIATFPDVLLDRARAPRPPTRGLDRGTRRANITGLLHTITTAGPGNRNRALYWAACRLAESAWVEGDPDQLVVAAVESGLSMDEAIRTTESGLHRSEARFTYFDPPKPRKAVEA